MAIRCSSCWNTWSGYGTICNECRQLESLEKMRTSSQQQSQQSNNTLSGGDLLSLIFSETPSWILWGIFLWFNYITNWWPIKIIWIIIGLCIHAVFVQWFGIGSDWVWIWD